jgi:CheY-like chemotaxis protein
MPAFEKDADEAASESPRRILIVEDEPDLAALLAYRLKQENYSTVISEDGIHACRLVDDVRPDLVLLDILLHGKNGWQVCEYIRTHDEKAIAAIPVIMLTALARKYCSNAIDLLQTESKNVLYKRNLTMFAPLIMKILIFKVYFFMNYLIISLSLVFFVKDFKKISPKGKRKRTLSVSTK